MPWRTPTVENERARFALEGLTDRFHRPRSCAHATAPPVVKRILLREGRIKPSKPRRRREHPGPPVPILPEPNGTRTADFKGEFRTQDGKLCYPLTVQDGHSRG